MEDLIKYIEFEDITKMLKMNEYVNEKVRETLFS